MSTGGNMTSNYYLKVCMHTVLFQLDMLMEKKLGNMNMEIWCSFYTSTTSLGILIMELPDLESTVTHLTKYCTIQKL